MRNEKISIPLETFYCEPWGCERWSQTDEFVITFEYDVARPRKGAIYIDEMAFEK